MGFRGILVIFWVLRVFWSFLGFGGILVIFKFRGYFGHLRGFGGYFAHFRDFGGILVILWVLEVLDRKSTRLTPVTS